MTDRRRHQCIDCGAPCTYSAYRCEPCGHVELTRYMRVTGRYAAMSIAAKEMQTARAARQAEERAERVEFVETQLGYGFTTDDIAADLGITHNAVARSLYRAGRPDLARRFNEWHSRNPMQKYTKGYRCEVCARPRSNESQHWCRACLDSGVRVAA